MGKCIVIGLQSTGEARTLEAVEVHNIYSILLKAVVIRAKRSIYIEVVIFLA